MTKEEILDFHVHVFEGPKSYEAYPSIDGLTLTESLYNAMSEYASQCTAPLEARIRELEEGLRELLIFCKTGKATVMNNVPPQTDNVAFTSASTENMIYSIIADRLTKLLSSSSSDGWIEGVPNITEECVFVTMRKIKYDDREEKYYRIWEVKLIEGVNDKDEGCYYLALLDATDGVEWGTFDELAADMTYILPKPPNTI